MGEVVVSSEDMDVMEDNHNHNHNHNLTHKDINSMAVAEADAEAEVESMDADTRNKENISTGVGIKWEKFLPKMRLSVLLVEADDSTRQIIAALLRKCCYRVAAVPDGLKAWEILKERPRNVDLILAEVELPSISGFALLTLIMEHDICKKIPVIMMSSQDSISTVYKCMMKGAADYLVKPLRRNELRNLWQHVWRRQASANMRNGPQDESIEEKVEVTSENETASNHSTGYVARVQRNNKNIEKGSDAQSSCTKVDFEVGSFYKREKQESLQTRQGNALLNDLKLQKDEPHVNLSHRLDMNENEAGGLAMGCYVNADLPITLSMGLEPSNNRLSPNILNEACDNNDLLTNPTGNATAFDHARAKYPDYNQSSSSPSTDATNKFDSALHLDLSLRRCYSNDFEGHGAEGRATLRQSSASAFTRYTYRPLQTVKPISRNICDQQKEYGSNPEQIMFGSIATSCTSDTLNPMLSLQKRNTPLPQITSQSNHSETATACRPESVIPVPVSLKDLRYNNQCSGYGSLLSPNFCMQPGPSPSPSPTSVTHPEPILAKKTFYPLNLENHNLEQLFKQHHIVNNATNQTIENLVQKLDSVENQGHMSPPTDHSANSSLCGGNATRLHSVGYTSTCGSNNNVDQVGIAMVVPESKNEEALFSQGGDSHRSSQREAALTKFRLKRKERCFEKKVRYESRKKLAEQRPRVKGQFVRRVFTDSFPAETSGNLSNS